MQFTYAISVLFILTLSSVMAQAQRRSYHAKHIADAAKPIIDGKLNDSIWLAETAIWDTGFVQYQPDENQSPTAQSAFSIRYDAKHLYIGIQCFDQSQKINKRMSRRDGYNGDWIEVIIDSYHDLRSAFSFSVSAAGVKSDKYISLNGAQEDIAWNPIWYANSATNNRGWTAEMKIPLSQLRFGNDDKQVWGLQVQRRILREEELSVWQRIPQDAPGWVSEFGKLYGIDGVKPQRQLEIQPFAISSWKAVPKDSRNSVIYPKALKTDFGMDGKLGVTNDLTFNFTINPDFGQVEADPAAIALDGFQLFFEEQRPFFIENKNIFDYRFSTPVIGSPYSNDNLFYTRRIGRKPQQSVSASSSEFVDAPSQTTILGAIKFSGKTKKGLSVAILESVTSREFATISDGNTRRKELIEPQTNYWVGRVQKDFNNRNTLIGGMVTSVIRSNEDQTSFLHQSAHTAGIDFLHQWKNRTWYIGTNLVTSHVRGTENAILYTQQSVPHLFQREEANHLNIDSTKTSLTGTGGDIKFGKAGNGHLQFESGFTWRSPGLELNDVGFMREADVIQHYFGITYQSISSSKAFRNASVGYKHWWNWDFEGNLNYIDWDIEFNATLKNNWSGTLGFFSQPHIYSKTLLQGGPRLLLSDQYGFWWAAHSDTRKKITVSYNGWTKIGGLGSYSLLENEVNISYQPFDRLRFSLTPKYTAIRHRLQYNESQEYASEKRYIVSFMDQNTLGFALRADLVINPNLAIQYYGEPFISTGTYHHFSYVAHPLHSIQDGQLNELGSLTVSEIDAKPAYGVDENKDELIDYHIQDPDFSFTQFRSNLVLRWEYRPGSEFYVVWAQGMTDNAFPTGKLLRSLDRQVFGNNMTNTFLVKATYRFHR